MILLFEVKENGIFYILNALIAKLKDKKTWYAHIHLQPKAKQIQVGKQNLTVC